MTTSRPAGTGSFCGFSPRRAGRVRVVRRGAVDIVIGTHRLLQNDVEFPKLGLLIIDEEHRFGVTDKERVKRLRKLVEGRSE